MSVRRTGSRTTRLVPAGGAKERPVEVAVLARQAGVRVTLVRRYLEFGLFQPVSGTGQSPLFEPSSASRLAKAERLRRDLGLNYAGAVLACELLDRIRELEDQVRVGAAQRARPGR
jgi:DNA-binding transcriptional MerR regulator